MSSKKNTKFALDKYTILAADWYAENGSFMRFDVFIMNMNPILGRYCSLTRSGAHKIWLKIIENNS